MGRSKRLVMIAVPVLGLVATAIVTLAPSADACINAIEAETMRSVERHGTAVDEDRDASDGRQLKVDSNVSVRAEFTLDRPGTYLQVQAHTDREAGPGALTTVQVDGVPFPSFFVNAEKWTPYSLSRGLGPGRHQIVIRFKNAGARNLYL